MNRITRLLLFTYHLSKFFHLALLILRFDFLILGMFAHRLLTLGHIVATTKIPWKKALGLGKEKKLNADKTLTKRGVDIVKRWQTAYQVSL